MSDTPLTDEHVLAYRTEDGSEMVHASFAAELETELNAMQARAEKAEAELAAERKKVRVLREALENGVAFPITVNWYEQAAAALDATKEAGK